MKKSEYISRSTKETEDIARNFAVRLVAGDVIVLEGALGVGKTIFVKGLAKGLGITETVTSPTFTIVSEYEGRLPLFHMDLYRLSDQIEFDYLGAEDYYNKGGITVIEWGEKARDLPEGTIHVSIRFTTHPTERLIIMH